MTREEAIKWLDKLYTRADITDEYGDMEYMQPYEEALDMAVKALEQESILDKIRAEIEKHCGLAKENHCKYCSYCNSLMGVREILGIIDKYLVVRRKND